MATTEMTIGDLKPFLDLAKSNVLGINITDFGVFFDKIEDLLRSTGQWTTELETQLGIAERELTANPELFDIGKGTFISSIEELLAKYPADTPLSEIPELQGDGGGGNPVIIEGPNGLDIAVLAEVFHSGVTVVYDPITKVVTLDGAGVDLSFEAIDRIDFADGTLAFDFDGIAGQAFRLYQAAFDRIPDDAGLSFWINTMDDGLGLGAAAAGFIGSKEFGEVYGTNVTDLEFVSRMYQNILGRDGEDAGIDFWTGQLAGGKSKVDVLVGFSESVENIRGVLPQIEDGIFYS